MTEVILSKEKHEKESSAPLNDFEPTEALEALKSREWPIKEVIDPILQTAFRNEISEQLKGRQTLRDAIFNTRRILEPWISDPTKIQPGSDDLLYADRLETIIGTEIIWAYNRGRLAIGQQAGEYVIGFQFSAIIDSRTTKICQKANGLILRKEAPTTIKLTPPLHPGCRSLLTYVTTDELPVAWSTDKQLNEVIKLKPKGFR